MVNKDKVARAVKSHLSLSEQGVVERIVSDVSQDAENIIQSMIRQAVAQERDKLFRQRMTSISGE